MKKTRRHEENFTTMINLNYIGDVRDYNSIEGAFIGVDYVFHAAALKQVPSCEFYPMEGSKNQRCR